MKFTYNWLREFLDTKLSADEIAYQLPMLGFEIDGFESLVPELDGIVVGKVVLCESYPQSDHLKRCLVDVGGQTLEVICGAPNVSAEQLVAVAPPGSTLPNGERIEARPISGVMSYGMICSENELGLSDDASQILVLENHATPGQRFREVVESDWLFDVAVTPNRPDAMGLIGLAREIAFLKGDVLKLPKATLKETGPNIDGLLGIDIKDPSGCPRYAARMLQHIQVGPSPQWMRKRLNAVGVRSISNLVDVTNYVMMETGQPLHAFDYDFIEKKKIVVQRAQNGESFQTLDEKVHELRDSDLLICDGVRAVGLAGVMGGQNTEVSEKTRHVVIECAHFDPLTVRRTAKRLGIPSEASRRFERGMDPNRIPYVINRTAQLMQLTAGGQIARGILDVYPSPIKPKKVDLRAKRVAQLLGGKVPAKQIEKILSGLGCKATAQNGAWRVTIPTYRPDLMREIDLIEEVGRIYGYDRFPGRTQSQSSEENVINRREVILEKIRQTMTGLGYDEAVTLDLISAKQAELFVTPGLRTLPLVNPLNEDMAVLRTSIIGTLLSSLAHNLNRKNRDVWLFENGTIFWTTADQKICEENRLGAIATGMTDPTSWKGAGRSVTIFDVRGAIETLAESLSIPPAEFVPMVSHHYFETGWEIRVAGQVQGWAGQIKAEVLSRYEIEENVYGFEFRTGNLMALVEWQKSVKKLPRFPAIERDLAVVVEAEVPAGKMFEVVKSAGGPLLEKFELFDVYTGKQIPAGKKSMAFSLSFRAPDRTLVDDEADYWMNNILEELTDKTGAVLRT